MSSPTCPHCGGPTLRGVCQDRGVIPCGPVPTRIVKRPADTQPLLPVEIIRAKAADLLKEYAGSVKACLQLCTYEQYLAEARNDETAWHAWHQVMVSLGRAVTLAEKRAAA